MADSAPAFQITDLSHRYGDRLALDNLTCTVESGRMLGILGPNGSGKSTLFRILSTLAAPQTGSVRIAGLDPAGNLAQVRRRLGVVFQSPGLDDRLTVRENLKLHGYFFGISGTALSDRIGTMLERFSLSDRANDRVDTLSGGLKRRAEIARCLLHGPDILLLDEPTTGLDPDARRDFWSVIRGVHADDKATILFTTHWFEDADHAGELAILDRGKLVASGTPGDLKDEVGDDLIVIRGGDLETLAGELAERFDIEPVSTGAQLRFNNARGSAFVAELLDLYHDRIESIEACRPSLEDVYIRKTGRAFAEDDGCM
jgi:ABC-2 type transport system ATP-binding protein